MQIYNYSEVTREYLGAQDAQPDPLETVKAGENIYLITANATTIAPPKAKEGFARCFLSDTWKQVEDHRGQTAYKKSDATTTIIGDLGPISDEYTLLAPCDYPRWDGAQWIVDEVLRQEQMVNLMQAYMDAKAKAYGYDNILSVISYANSSVAKWKTEAAAFKQWRDDVWSFGLTILEAVAAGKNTITTEAELIAALPVFPLD